MIKLEKVKKEDLAESWEIAYGPKADLKWMALNGPYFKDPVLTKEEFLDGWGKTIVGNLQMRVIVHEEKIVGMATSYWEDGKLKQWLEVGIVIYNERNWGKGIGSVALKMWLKTLFSMNPELPHLSFTTWSGNPGMEKIGEKAGMQKEGVIRKVRFWQGKYYDSVKYGILREELLD